ncbi:MAG: hypothetical protein ABSG42_07985 [Nitrospirota bacterium]
MKKALLSLMTALFIFSIAVSSAFADTKTQGTLKAIDTAKGTVVFCPKGTKKDITLKAGSDLTQGYKAGDNVILTYDKDTVKQIRKMMTKIPVGC